MDDAQTKNKIIDLYESLSYSSGVSEYYGQSYFLNYGYWEVNTPDPKSACENLMEKLLAFIPEKHGTILDVACGNGATTAYLSKYFLPENITGINISSGQVEIARTLAPGCSFLLMDATQLDFPDNTFDNIICVEAAFHFDTREKFLKDAYRVLKPGGHLVVSDILLTLEAEKTRDLFIKENFLEGPEAYGDLLQKVEYGEVQILDATRPCWKGHFMYLVNYVHEKFLGREVGYEEMQRYLFKPYRRVPALQFYLLAAGKKI